MIQIWRNLPRYQQIIVAIVGLLGVICTACASIMVVLIPIYSSRSLPPSQFNYSVRIQSRETGESIENAGITIDVAGQAPLSAVTDTNGTAIIVIDGERAGQLSTLTVHANNRKKYTQSINLLPERLPVIVQLALTWSATTIITH